MTLILRKIDYETQVSHLYMREFRFKITALIYKWYKEKKGYEVEIDE